VPLETRQVADRVTGRQRQAARIAGAESRGRKLGQQRLPARGAVRGQQDSDPQPHPQLVIVFHPVDEPDAIALKHHHVNGLVDAPP
jgi:hypothetical protein